MKWLITWDYPKVPPKVTIEPTDTMIVETSHPALRPDRSVNVYSSQNWTPTSLQRLHSEIISAFQAQTPLVCCSIIYICIIYFF